MYLTKSILEQYQVSQEIIDWFERHFPKGANLIELIKMPHIPISFLHWIRLNLTTNEDERRAYNEVLHITDSTNFWECQNIDHCDMITGSNDVQYSKYIYDSQHIKESEDVSDSENVQNSHKIYNSTRIYSSMRCAHANNIKESFNITFSDFILHSQNIYKSSLITNSMIILNSKNIEDSGFISNCQNLKHCLFNYNQKNVEYRLFNEPIGETQWNFIYEEFQNQLNGVEANLFDPWDPEIVGHGAHCHLTQNIQFAPILTKEVIHWIKHLPYYNAEMMYKITFHPSFLE